jgi:lipid II:glycine glycyltransferase (peptidoglycan interpeptide bridge formation enzyme)
VIAVLGDTAYYLFGASADEALQLKAGYALHWWVLRRLADSGARWYDLGTDVRDSGLRQFKKGFVGKAGAVVVMGSEYDHCTNLPSRFATDAIYGVRELKRSVRAWRDRYGDRGTGPQAPS